GLVRDSEGQKMSKSKGNVLDPIDVIDGIELEALVNKRTQDVIQPHLIERIEKITRKNFPEGIPPFGCDALRFTFASLATHGRDVVFGPGRIEGYRNFCNKLWNATRYVLMQAEDKDTGLNNDDVVELSLADRWIISKLQHLEARIEKHIESSRLDLLAHELYSFVWEDYCDWYLELSKPVLLDENTSEQAQRGTRQTLVRVLETILRLNHPIIPFITEECWQRVAPLAGKSGDSIMLQPYPESDESKIDKDAEDELEWVKTFITGVRRIRSERDIDPRKLLAVKIKGGTELEQNWIGQNSHYLKEIGRVESITAIDEAPDDAVIALAGEMTILVPLADLIDPQAELIRLEKELEKLRKNSDSIAKKLENKNFVDRAPVEVVQKEQERLEESNTSIEKLEEQYQRILKLTQ
ncbi:MAG: class I tRNA ligase family protein, partial [Gammaproteobacteria bacterium]|nr:class I tRNA ligase family protein [Gammaproteobacteria bacterium]